MELLKQYWWVVAGVLVLLLFVMRRPAATGPTVTQIGGGADGLAAAQLSSQNTLASDAQRIGLVNTFLNYALETDRVDRADQLERLRLESGERVAIRQAQATEVAAQYGQNTANTQANLAYQLQLQALQNQRDQQRANSPQWWQYLLGGVDRYGGLLIDIFDGDTPGFSFGGNSGGGWDDWVIGGGFGGGWGFG